VHRLALPPPLHAARAYEYLAPAREASS
jgi:hypothetical protein